MGENNSKWNNRKRINFQNIQAPYGLPHWLSAKESATFRKMQEIWVQSLGGEDPLQKGMATHSSILAWRIPWTEEPGEPQSMGSQSWTQLSDWKAQQHEQLIQINTWENKQPNQRVGKRPKQTFFQRRYFVVGQSPWCVWLFATPCTAHQASLSFTISWSLPKLCPLHQWCCLAISSSDALFSFCPQSFPASGTFPKSQLFASHDQNTGVSASVLPTSIQGLFFLRLNGFDLLPVQGTLRSFLQHHSLKASILWGSAFFLVQLSQPYVTTVKTTALTIQPLLAE